jgi:hypothetical protein
VPTVGGMRGPGVVLADPPRWRWAVATATFALFGLHLVLSRQIGAPTVVFDETGYLGNARWFAGGAPWEMPLAPFYSAAYSLLLAPSFTVLHEPHHQWLAVRVVNAALLASLLPLLASMLQRVFGASRPVSLSGATLGALAPAVVAAGVSGIAENLVLPLVPLAVLAAHAAASPERRTAARIGLGPMVGLLWFAHPRFTAVLPLVGMGLLWWWRAGRLPRAVAAGNLVGLGAVVALGSAANRAVRDGRWAEVERLEGGTSAWFELLSSPEGLGEVAATAVGQSWYLLAGSVGLVVVGVVAVARRGLSATGAGATSVGADDPMRLDDERARPASFACLGLLLAAAAVFATSVLFFAQNQFRGDHFVYGRHNDTFVPLWIASAVAMFAVPGERRRIGRLLLGAAGAIVMLGAVVVVVRPTDEPWTVFSPFAVPAVYRYVGDDLIDLVLRATVGAALLALAAGTAVMAAHRRGPPPPRRPSTVALSVALLGAASVGMGLGSVQATATFHGFVYDDWGPESAIERLAIDELCIDASAVRARANLSYGWALPNVAIRTYDAVAGEQPPCPFTVARLDDPARPAAGDRIALLDQGGLDFAWEAPLGLAVWVAPGAEQRRLDADGALLPVGFPLPLPPAARRGTVEIVGTLPETVRVAPGGRVPLTVRVRHTGSSAPWPDGRSFSLDGGVRVVADIAPLDGPGVRGGRSGGELGAWLLPGDEATSDVEVIAIDEVLEPLPPGRYRVVLGVGQVGEDWFEPGGDRARFVLEVTS